MRITLRSTLAAVCVSVGALSGLGQSGPPRTDEYTRYDMLTLETSSVRMTYELSATTEGARTYIDAIPAGATASDIAVYDMMAGEPLKFVASARAITVTLARPVPPKGQGRLRIEKTVRDPRAYRRDGNVGVFALSVGAGRHNIVLPAGHELVGCNIRLMLEESPYRCGASAGTAAAIASTAYAAAADEIHWSCPYG
jgi:hypothetical protein